MSVVALVPVTGRAGRFGPYSAPDIGVANADAGLSATSEIPLLAPTLNNLFAADCIDLVAVVVPQSQVDRLTGILSGLTDRGELGDHIAKGTVRVVGVDEDTFDSTPANVRNSVIPRALDVLPTASVVLIHQLRHAYAPPELVRQVVDAVLAGAPAVVPVLPCTDTVKQLDDAGVIIDTPDRTALRVVQAPLGVNLRPALVRSSAQTRPDGTPPHETPPDEMLPPEALPSGALRPGGLPAGTRTVPGHPAARAIRTSFDLAFAKATPVAEPPATGGPTSPEV
jgi:2-C-methyl-D-erythritol 4-phosphate cytidylyltransferase